VRSLLFEGRFGVTVRFTVAGVTSFRCPLAMRFALPAPMTVRVMPIIRTVSQKRARAMGPSPFTIPKTKPPQMSLKLRSRVSCVVPRALLAPKWTCFGLERAQLDYLSNESSGTALGRSCRGWSKAFLNSLNNRLTLASIVDTKFNFFAFFGPKDHLPQRRGYREVSFL
jgi:hypothetical protein